MSLPVAFVPCPNLCDDLLSVEYVHEERIGAQSAMKWFSRTLASCLAKLQVYLFNHSLCFVSHLEGGIGDVALDFPK